MCNPVAPQSRASARKQIANTALEPSSKADRHMTMNCSASASVYGCGILRVVAATSRAPARRTNSGASGSSKARSTRRSVSIAASGIVVGVRGSLPREDRRRRASRRPRASFARLTRPAALDFGKGDVQAEFPQNSSRIESCASRGSPTPCRMNPSKSSSGVPVVKVFTLFLSLNRLNTSSFGTTRNRSPR
jgi:hypothetical protein